MKKDNRQFIRDYLERAREKTHKKRVIVALSLIVGISVVMNMIQPASTLTTATVCGLEEHAHAEECFAEGVLVCELPEHIHTDACHIASHDEEPTLVDFEDEVVAVLPMEEAPEERAELSLDDLPEEDDIPEAAGQIIAADEYAPLEAYIITDSVEIRAGEPVALEFVHFGGAEPAIQTVSIRQGDKLLLENALVGDDVDIIPDGSEAITVTLTVTDSLGNTITTESTIPGTEIEEQPTEVENEIAELNEEAPVEPVAEEEPEATGERAGESEEQIEVDIEDVIITEADPETPADEEVIEAPTEEIEGETVEENPTDEVVDEVEEAPAGENEEAPAEEGEPAENAAEQDDEANEVEEPAGVEEGEPGEAQEEPIIEEVPVEDPEGKSIDVDAEESAEEPAEEPTAEPVEGADAVSELTCEGEGFAVSLRWVDAPSENGAESVNEGIVESDEADADAVLRINEVDAESYAAYVRAAEALLVPGVEEAAENPAEEPTIGETEEAADIEGVETEETGELTEVGSEDEARTETEKDEAPAFAKARFFTVTVARGEDEFLPEGATLTLTVADENAALIRVDEVPAISADGVWVDYRGEIVGFAVPNIEEAEPEAEEVKEEAPVEAPAEEESEQPEEEAPVYAESLSCAGEGYTVTLICGMEAEIPADATLEAREILPGTAEYALYSDQTDATLDEAWHEAVAQPRFFDITILLDGEEIQPAAPVSVRIDLDEAVSVPEDESAEVEDVQAIHFADEGAQLLSADSRQPEAAAEVVSFDAESFSVYGIVPTATLTRKVITAEGETFVIHVTYGRDAEIPEGATLAAAEVTAESDPETYNEYTARSAAALTGDPAAALYLARLFDISIVTVEDGVETKAEPADTVSVEIRMEPGEADDADAENTVSVVHFAGEEEQPQVIEPETDEDAGQHVVSFETDSFSWFQVVQVESPEGDDPLNIDGLSFMIVSDSPAKSKFDSGSDSESGTGESGTGDSDSGSGTGESETGSDVDWHAAMGGVSPDSGVIEATNVALAEYTKVSTAWPIAQWWTFEASGSGYKIKDAGGNYLAFDQDGKLVLESESNATTMTVTPVNGLDDVYQISAVVGTKVYRITLKEGFTENGYNGTEEQGANTYLRLCTAIATSPKDAIESWDNRGDGYVVSNDRQYAVVKYGDSMALSYANIGNAIKGTPDIEVQDGYLFVGDAELWRFKCVAPTVPYSIDDTNTKDDNYYTYTDDENGDPIETPLGYVRYYVCCGSDNRMQYINFVDSQGRVLGQDGNISDTSFGVVVSAVQDSDAGLAGVRQPLRIEVSRAYGEERFRIYYEEAGKQVSLCYDVATGAFKATTDATNANCYLNLCTKTDPMDNESFVLYNAYTNRYIHINDDTEQAITPASPVLALSEPYLPNRIAPTLTLSKSPYSESYYIQSSSFGLYDNGIGYGDGAGQKSFTKDSDADKVSWGEFETPGLIIRSTAHGTTTWLYDSATGVITSESSYSDTGSGWTLQPGSGNNILAVSTAGEVRLFPSGTGFDGDGLYRDGEETWSNQFTFVKNATIQSSLINPEKMYAIASILYIENNNRKDRVRAMALSSDKKNDNYLKDKNIYVTQYDASGDEWAYVESVYEEGQLNATGTTNDLLWKFEPVAGKEGVYHIRSVNTGNYLRVQGGRNLSTAPLGNADEFEFIVVQYANTTGVPKQDQFYIRTADGKYQLNLGGDAAGGGYHAYNARDWKGDRVILCEYVTEVEQKHEYYKLGATELTSGQPVVIYERVIDGNEETLYAVASVMKEDKAESRRLKVYDEGVKVGWRDNTPDDASAYLWDYVDLGNGYYTFKNHATGQYLMPQAGGFLTDRTRDVGVSLKGRDNGDYATTIAAWDETAKSFYSLETPSSGDLFTSAAGKGTTLFYFAQEALPEVYNIYAPSNGLKTVPTVDSVALGIKISLFDYDRNKWGAVITNPADGTAEQRYVDWRNSTQSSYLTDASATPFEQNIIRRMLDDDGYPVAYPHTAQDEKGKSYHQTSLKDLFSGSLNNPDKVKVVATETANHLFLQSVYDATGYLEYSSFNNYAYYGGNGDNFTVYENIGSPIYTNISNSDQQYSFYLTRGNFMPFNDLNKVDDRNRSTLSINYNLHDEDGYPLDVNDPRLGEKIYAIENPNYMNGMLMEANFYQAKDGVTDRGTDMIYEFNGDDDLWVFIDGVLVLDIGGIHDAHSGSINFKTGVVHYGVGPEDTYLDELFRLAFEQAGRTDWDIYKAEHFEGHTFKNYSTHSFKMFYMERGSGASNLHMRLNLPTFEAGKLKLTKKLEQKDGSVPLQENYGNVTYAYQLLVKDGNYPHTDENGATKGVSNAAEDGYYTVIGNTVEGSARTLTIGAKYAAYIDGTDTPITFENDGKFYLKAGQTATFDFPADDMEYFVRELDVPASIYEVKFNDTGKVPVENVAASADATVKNQPQLEVTNTIKKTAVLKITKNVVDESGEAPTSFTDAIKDRTFNFRVYLENREGKLAPYSVGDYYVTRVEGAEKRYYTYGTSGLTDQGTVKTVANSTGQNGTIEGIPWGYTVEIEGLTPGTRFVVVEDSIPDGYELRNYTGVSGTLGDVTVPTTTGLSYKEEKLVFKNDKNAEYDAVGGCVGSDGADVGLAVNNTLKTVEICLRKTDNAETPNPLTGAEFTLGYVTENGVGSVFTDHNGDAVVYRPVEAEAQVTIRGIPCGRVYVLNEIKAPDGYNLPSAPFYFKVDADGAVSLCDQSGTAATYELAEAATEGEAPSLTKVITVKNIPGVRLPDTGGTGTLAYTVGGILLIVVAGLMLILRRKEY